jgi:tRNA pseudouridine32 synthase/23S rRNA pseudouridine746 synthase
VSDALPPLALLHEDHDLVAVAKPSGEPVIAARGEPRSACLQKRLESRLRRRLWVVHRIDRDASGVVVFALNADAHRVVSLAFEHRQVTKTYAAFVTGAIEPARGRIEVPLHGARKGKTRPARPGEPGAQPATTEYATRKRWILSPDATGAPRDDTVCLVDARPVTGRHHQIRVHLRSAGTPILFDPLYGRGLMPEGLAGAPCARLALHARRIELPAPRGSARVVVEAPLEPDLAALADWLDVHGRGQTIGV